MQSLLTILLIAALAATATAQDKAAYRLYTKDGKPTTYADLLKAAAQTDVVFFGEEHNNAIAHWLQLELTRDLYKEVGDRLVLGAEMMEADDQLLINEYFEGRISNRSFEQEARLWDNYATDYKPLLEFARVQGLDFVATNIPRRYASMVFRMGKDSLAMLSDEARRYIAPLPLEVDLTLPGYAAMLEMGGPGMGGHAGKTTFPEAQAIKDATMAHFIATNRGEKGVFLHCNGHYHSDGDEGILWYLRKYAPGTRTLTLTTRSVSDLDALPEEARNKADFILLVPESMTKTY